MTAIAKRRSAATGRKRLARRRGRTSRASSQATAIVLVSEGFRVPQPLDFGSFRAWARSDDFPESGRIDYLDGEIDIDMSPEDLDTHGAVKVAISYTLHGLIVRELRIGVVYSDRARVSSPRARLSAEPDVVVLLDESMRSGAIRFKSKARKKDRVVEIVGPADLVVECVSDSSVGKDTRKLRSLLHKAGVREYWIADARGSRVKLSILRRASDDYVEVAADRRGFTESPLLGRAFRLVRDPSTLARETFDLEMRLPARRRPSRP